MERPNFQFRRREEKLDWKKLAALDVDQITKTVDYKALQDSIRQITYCDATKEFDSDKADPNLIKVFRMSQLIIEYLLQSQDFLANNLANVEQRLNSTLEELEHATSRSRREQDELRDLRRDLRAQTSSTVMTLTGHQRCQFCQKVFINTTYLQSHMMRRHNHMVSKQLSNQTLSTVTHDQAQQRSLEAELEQVRQRLMVAEQQLMEERRRVSALEEGSSYQPPVPIKEEVETMASDRPSPPSAAGSAAGSRQGSGQGSAAGSGPPSAGPRDDRLAALLDQQAAEIRQLRQELENQRQAHATVQLAGVAAAADGSGPESSRVQKEMEKQTRRDMVALEGRLEAQERYWQDKLRCMRERHDAEVESMRRVLKDKEACTRGSPDYVNIDSGPEESPRLLRFVQRHQSPSPAPPPTRVGRRPRPCIARPQRRSRSVSGCRKLKFADDDCVEEEDEDDDRANFGPARESFSTDGLGRSGGRAGAAPRLRQELESELNERLLELGIEPGTRCISSGLMIDKMRHLQAGRRVQGFGDLRRQVDDDVNQRLAKFHAGPVKRSSRLALFARDMMARGADVSRSLVSLGNRGRVPSSATIDAQLMQRAAAVGAAPPLRCRRTASHSPSAGRRAAAGSGWIDDDDSRDGHYRSRYDEEDDFAPSQDGPQRPFKFRANASKHILERFTRRGQGQSSLIKSTTIHRVDSDDDGGDAGGRYEKLRDDKPPAGRRGSSSSLAKRAPSAERKASSGSQEPSAGFGVFQGGADKASRPPTAAGSGSQSAVAGLRPESAPDAEGFTTPASRPSSHSSLDRPASSGGVVPFSAGPGSPASLERAPSGPGSPASLAGPPSAAGVSGASLAAAASSGARASGSGLAAASSGSAGSPASASRIPSLPQAGSDASPAGPSGFDENEMSATIELEHVEPSTVRGAGADAVDAKPSGSANTLSTSVWNPSEGADGAAAADSSAAEDEPTQPTSSGEESADSDTETGDDQVMPMG